MSDRQRDELFPATIELDETIERFFVDPWLSDNGWALYGVTEDGFTAAGGPNSDLADGLDPAPGEELALLHARTLPDGGVELLVRVGDDIGVLPEGSTDVEPLEIPGDALSVRFAGDDVVYLLDDGEGCVLGWLDAESEVELPLAACAANDLAVDQVTGEVLLAAGQSTLAVEDGAVTTLARTSVEVEWDPTTGVLWLLASSGELFMMEKQDGSWLLLHRLAVGSVASMGAMAGAVALLTPRQDESIVTVVNALTREFTDLVIEGEFDTVVGAADASFLAVTGAEESLIFEYVPTSYGD